MWERWDLAKAHSQSLQTLPWSKSHHSCLSPQNSYCVMC